MPLAKKTIILISVLLIITSSFSGCILDDWFGGTSFSLSSWNITDDEGFPSIQFSYTCSDRVTVKLYDPNNNEVDDDFFLRGPGQVNISLGSYREIISVGNYKLKVKDKGNEQIYSKTFKFVESDASILSCSQKWWTNGDTEMLIGLTMSVENNGDMPIYPYSVEADFSAESVSGYVLPCAILPGETKSIDCSIYKNGAPLDNTFTVILKDKDENIIDTLSCSADIRGTVATRTFAEGVESILRVPYPEFLHDYYKSLERAQHEDYSYYIFDPYDDPYIDALVDCLILTLPFGQITYNAKSEVEKVDFIVSFVQNIAYEKDSNSDEAVEYPNYPIETLFNGSGKGDCEDKAILTAGLLDNIGFESALFRLPNHMAAGVKLETSLQNFDYYNDSYYFVETTTPGNPVGFVPNSYKTPSELTVYTISDRELLLHHWKGNTLTIYTNTDIGDFVKVKMIVSNMGRKTANNILVKGVFTTFYGYKIKVEETTISSLKSGMKAEAMLKVNIPKSALTNFKTEIYLDGVLMDEKESASTFPT